MIPGLFHTWANGHAHVWNRRVMILIRSIVMMINNIIRPARPEQRRFPIFLTLLLTLQVSQELAPCPALRNVGGMLTGLTSHEATGAAWGQHNKSGNRHQLCNTKSTRGPPVSQTLWHRTNLNQNVNVSGWYILTSNTSFNDIEICDASLNLFLTQV